MRLPTLLALFLILCAAPSSIAAGPSQNNHIPLNCQILRRNDECIVEQCTAAGALCVPNPNPKLTICVQNRKDSGTERGHWTASRATREVCRGCYCGTTESLEAAEHRRLETERRKLAAARRTSLKRKVEELEIIDGNCIMTSRSRTSEGLCNAHQCYEHGIRCLPISDGRCFLHFQEDEKRIQKGDIGYPASCSPCTCKIMIRDWREFIEDPSVLEPSVLGPLHG
jgi:hypothetical protein